MDFGLTGKRALVLGSTRGIGRAIAEHLAAEGADVAVSGRDRESGQQLAEEIAANSGRTARAYTVDLMKPDSVKALIDDVANDFGGLDVIVLNGGGPPPGSVSEVATETWEQQFRAMVLSQMEIAGAFLPGMRERKWGRILITSSSGAVQPIPNLGISNTLRASLITWAKTLSAEVAKDGVTINTVLPGRIQTARVNQIDEAAAEKQGKSVDEIRSASMATIPMGRYGTVDEFAKVATFLVSDCASYVTGSVVPIDGGYIRGA